MRFVTNSGWARASTVCCLLRLVLLVERMTNVSASQLDWYKANWVISFGLHSTDTQRPPLIKSALAATRCSLQFDTTIAILILSRVISWRDFRSNPPLPFQNAKANELLYQVNLCIGLGTSRRANELDLAKR